MTKTKNKPMVQMALPFTGHPSIDPSLAADIIRSQLDEESALLGTPRWDCIENEWRALVAITHSGPLLVMGFRLKPS